MSDVWNVIAQQAAEEFQKAIRERLLTLNFNNPATICKVTNIRAWAGMAPGGGWQCVCTPNLGHLCTKCKDAYEKNVAAAAFGPVDFNFPTPEVDPPARCSHKCRCGKYWQHLKSEECRDFCNLCNDKWKKDHVKNT